MNDSFRMSRESEYLNKKNPCRKDKKELWCSLCSFSRVFKTDCSFELHFNRLFGSKDTRDHSLKLQDIVKKLYSEEKLHVKKLVS